MIKKVTMKKGRRIIENKVRCKRCGDILVSTDPNEIIYCSCLAIHVSGGNRKTLRGGDLVFMEDRSVFA